MTASNPFIVIIDDDESVRDSLKSLLRSAGYRAVAFPSAELFLDSGAAAYTGCLILDVRMPGIDGLELHRQLKTLRADLPVIFITAHDEGALRQRVIQNGAVDLLHKPFSPGDLLSTVQSAMGPV